ncbi:MAG TPA: hypothetical protein VD970_01525 [Acetobacteraceae bacterium]|nr:hypothetical protein [Acetobacteraceae bacterium]
MSATTDEDEGERPKPVRPPERRVVGPEDEERKSPEGPGAQIRPEVEPSGS